MAVVVSLRSVVDEIDVLSDECTAYLNRKTGDLYTLQDDEERLAEEDDLEDLPDWQRDSLPLIREILESEDWLQLPTKFEIHEWEMMDKFALTLKDETLGEAIRDTIRGAGAFRHFRQLVSRNGLEQQWYQFKQGALEQIAVAWLEEHEIAYTREETSGL